VITESEYNFSLKETGKGGVTDKGTYELTSGGAVSFSNKQGSLLAVGQLKKETLSLTFVNSVVVMMLGTEAASSISFALSDDEDESSGFLIIQNLSTNKTLVGFGFYDIDGDYLGSDSDELEAGYQFTYEVETGSYIVKVTDSANKTFTSKSFKVLKGKSTVLAYNGSALEVIATGLDDTELLKSKIGYVVLNTKTFKHQ